jgi:hypothetical protein
VGDLTSFDNQNQTLLQHQIVNEYKNAELGEFANAVQFKINTEGMVTSNQTKSNFYADIKLQNDLVKGKPRTAAEKTRRQHPNTYDIQIRSFKYKGVPDTYSIDIKNDTVRANKQRCDKREIENKKHGCEVF